MNRNFLYFILFFHVCVGMPTGLQAAHPYHVSLTEIEFNPSTGNFEVAVCLWPADVERALAIQEKKPIDLDKTAKLDSILQRYMERRFKVQLGEDHSTKMRWVGHETNNKQTWLYFEVKLPAGFDVSLSKVEIDNRLFFELNDDQLNQVNFRNGKQLKSVTCVRGKSLVEITP